MDEPKYPTSCVERFLDYVKLDTQSREGSDTFPSTESQWVLLRKLVAELRQMGIADVEIDPHGYVFATLPATTGKRNVPTIGFLAHVDTSPETTGAGVRPILHPKWSGEAIVLPDDPTIVLRTDEDPDLASQLGRDIITASGTTLLGADDKAGVAEIMGAAEWLSRHPEIPHGVVRLGFTPDEEVGQGTRFFDVARFGAHCAYTLDGGRAGELQTETFSADSIHCVFHGFNTHPGYAKGKMVNAIKVAADFIARLPPGRLSPETTAGHEGYVHPYIFEGGVDRAAVKILLRDFATPGLRDHEALVRGLAEEAVRAYPGSRCEVELNESYRNMKAVLDQNPQIVERASEAIARAGLELRNDPIRGGTDGSRLSFMGLPTPNLFAGEHAIHSRKEWVSTWEMHKAVEVIIEICRVWEERAPS